MASTSKPFLATLAGASLTRPPFWLMRQAGRYLPEFRSVRAQAGGFLNLCFNPDLAVEVTLQPLRRYGMDAAILFSDILVIPYALGQKLEFLEGEGPRLEPIRSFNDIVKLTPEAIHDRLAVVYEIIKRLTHAIPENTALIGFAGAPWTVASYMVEGKTTRDFIAIKNFAFGCPQEFKRLLDLLVDVTTSYLIAQADAGAEALQLFDSWAGVVPASHFRSWVVEPTRKIVAGVRKKHPTIPIIGFPRAAGLNYSMYIAESNVTAVSLDPMVPTAWAAANAPKTMALQGNLDPLALVAGGAVLAEGVAEIRKAFTGRPFIFNLGHGVLPQTPPEHVADLVSLLRK
ncbi:Uroporphyrinogen decarboxylase [Azospirillaceae bacterium]